MNDKRLQPIPTIHAGAAERDLHPAWREFIRYCTELRHGEVEKLSIQDGLPVLAETTRKKVKFTRER
jgi:hypothetical protein